MNVVASAGITPTIRQWKPYPAYKDSGVGWLGKIPEHWEVKRLKFAAKVNMGQSPSSEEYNIVGDGLPFLQGNAEFGIVHPDPKLYCPTARKRTLRGDILLSVRAPVGALNVADQEYGIGRGLCAISPNGDGLANKFARYLLEFVRLELNIVATGSTYEAVSVDEVGSLRCVLPPLKEQHTIANFLDRETAKIDALLAKKERLIELFQEKRAAVISQAVTKGLDPNVPMKDSGVEWLGKIPAHWEVAPLYARYEVALGKMLDTKRISGEYLAPYLRNVDVQWDRVNVDGLPEMDFAPADRSRYALHVGDLLVCKGGEVGRTAMWRGELEKCYYQKAVHRLRPIRGKDVARFFYYVMHATAKGGRFVAGGNPNTIDHLTAIQLKHYSFAFPPREEQMAIAGFLDREIAKLDALVAKVREGIEKLKEYRTALISAAVTGKIDVRGTIST